MKIVNFSDLDTADQEVVLQEGNSAILERLEYCTSTTRWLRQIRDLASGQEEGYVMCSPVGEVDFCWIPKKKILAMQEENYDRDRISLILTMEEAYTHNYVLVGTHHQYDESVAVYSSSLGGVFLTDHPFLFGWIALPPRVLLGCRSKIITRMNIGDRKLQINLGFARQTKAMISFKKKR